MSKLVTPTTKSTKCTICHIEKPIDQFNKNASKKNGRNTDCKACFLDAKLKRKYGLTTDERDQMLLDQAGECRICSSAIVFGGQIGAAGKSVACVDHCHTSGHVRGILCGACNMMLGKGFDEPAILRAGAKYLEENADEDIR